MKSMPIFKRLLISGLLLGASGAALAADVGVSISIGEPGFYGRIDIGDYPYPRPRLIYPNPIIVHPGVYYEPLYLRVPPGHAKNWKRYCGRYDACGYPTYFVQDSWYRHEYVPIYRQRHGYYDRYDRDERHHEHNDYYNRDERYDRGGDRDRHEGGRGHGNGKGGKGGKGRD